MNEVAQSDVLRANVLSADDLGNADERVDALLELLDEINSVELSPDLWQKRERVGLAREPGRRVTGSCDRVGRREVVWAVVDESAARRRRG